jgi:hypothetical protein
MDGWSKRRKRHYFKANRDICRCREQIEMATTKIKRIRKKLKDTTKTLRLATTNFETEMEKIIGTINLDTTVSIRHDLKGRRYSPDSRNAART